MQVYLPNNTTSIGVLSTKLVSSNNIQLKTQYSLIMKSVFGGSDINIFQPIGHFRYITIKLKSEAERTQTKKNE